MKEEITPASTAITVFKFYSLSHQPPKNLTDFTSYKLIEHNDLLTYFILHSEEEQREM